MQNKIIHIDLFSGQGGFSKGLEMAGFKFHKTYYSDIEEYPNKVFAKNYPNAIPLGDITKIDIDKLKEDLKKTTVIITAGFP